MFFSTEKKRGGTVSIITNLLPIWKFLYILTPDWWACSARPYQFSITGFIGIDTLWWKFCFQWKITLLKKFYQSTALIPTALWLLFPPSSLFNLILPVSFFVPFFKYRKIGWPETECSRSDAIWNWSETKVADCSGSCPWFTSTPRLDNQVERWL